MRNITKNNTKAIGIPKTVQEKYDKLKAKNPAIDLLRDKFNLDLPL
jgi:hypothetical protein